jgi:hypothetical protein
MTMTRLREAENDGVLFEECMWYGLLDRGFSPDGLKLPSFLLVSKSDATTVESKEIISIRLDEYVISGAKPKKMRDEMKMWRARAEELGINILYRAPKGGDSIHFCIFTEKGKTLTLQASISPLVKHRKPSKKLLNDPELAIERYIYITTKPMRHRIVAAKKEKGKLGFILNRLRVLDAYGWISGGLEHAETMDDDNEEAEEDDDDDDEEEEDGDLK